MWINENRSLVLSAIHTLFVGWLEARHPRGKTKFTSFPKWAEIVGGIMTHHNLGDPCLPHVDNQFGGDRRTRAMKSLYQVAYESNPHEWFTKSQIYNLITEEQRAGEDNFEFWGDLESETKGTACKTSVGIALKSFDNRVLSDITMITDTSNPRASRQLVKFTKAGSG